MPGSSPHYSRDRDDYKTFERKRRKHRLNETDNYEKLEVGEDHAVIPDNEVIQIHGSSSEDEASASVRRKHKHSHKHKKHRRHDSKTEWLRPEFDSAQGSQRNRVDLDVDELRSRTKKHKRDDSYGDSSQVLLENVQSSRDVAQGKRHRSSSSKVKDERNSRDSSSRIKESGSSLARNEIYKESSSRDKSRVKHSGSRVKEEPQSPPLRSRIKEERISRERSRLKEEPREYSLARVKREQSEGNRPRDNSHSQSRHGRRTSPRPRTEDNDEHTWGRSSTNPAAASAVPSEKDKPDFKLSGKLTEDRNTYNGVVIKYSEPPEARMPKKRWRFYQFKGDEALPILYIHRQSAYLIGRDRKVADLPVDHPSCSKQHAALQYRLVTFERANGSVGKQIRLYLIDLESANGTFINGDKIEPKKYVELREKDVVKFGMSSREYVLLHEQSKDDELSETE